MYSTRPKRGPIEANFPLLSSSTFNRIPRVLSVAPLKLPQDSFAGTLPKRIPRVLSVAPLKRQYDRVNNSSYGRGIPRVLSVAPLKRWGQKCGRGKRVSYSTRPKRGPIEAGSHDRGISATIPVFHAS